MKYAHLSNVERDWGAWKDTTSNINCFTRGTTYDHDTKLIDSNTKPGAQTYRLGSPQAQEQVMVGSLIKTTSLPLKPTEYKSFCAQVHKQEITDISR